VISKSPSKVIEFSAVQARQQFDTISAQNQLLALAQKVTTEPIKQSVTKAFSKVV
jgi:hypothetical protein